MRIFSCKLTDVQLFSWLSVHCIIPSHRPVHRQKTTIKLHTYYMHILARIEMNATLPLVSDIMFAFQLISRQLSQLDEVHECHEYCLEFSSY